MAFFMIGHLEDRHIDLLFYAERDYKLYYIG